MKNRKKVVLFCGVAAVLLAAVGIVTQVATPEIRETLGLPPAGAPGSTPQVATRSRCDARSTQPHDPPSAEAHDSPAASAQAPRPVRNTTRPSHQSGTGRHAPRERPGERLSDQELVIELPTVVTPGIVAPTLLLQAPWEGGGTVQLPGGTITPMILHGGRVSYRRVERLVCGRGRAC